MMHALLVYALAGIVVAFGIATIDILIPTKQMGVGWTLFFGVVWPFFVLIVVVVIIRARRRGMIDRP